MGGWTADGTYHILGELFLGEVQHHTAVLGMGSLAVMTAPLSALIS